MSMSESDLQKTLLEISASLLSVQKQLDELKKNPVMNGAFERICKEVSEQHAAIHRIELALVNPVDGSGVLKRLGDLETDNNTRKDFMVQTVMPSLEQFQKMRFQMESHDANIKKLGELEDEVSSLKLKQAISSKVAWGAGLTALGIAVSKLAALLTAGTP